MAYIYVNPNPKGAHIGDCVIRAIAIANEMTWNQTYNTLADYGFKMKNMPNADSVWGKVLKDMGYTMKPIPDTCPDCYTVREFCKDLTGPSLEILDKMAHTLKSLKTIDAMEGYSEDDGYHHDGMSYARGRGTYANRDGMGRYAEDDRYPERYR